MAHHRHQLRFGQARVVEQRRQHARLRIEPQAGDHRHTRTARQGAPLPGRQPRKPLEQPPVRRSPHERMDPHVAAQGRQLAPVEAGHELHRQRPRGTGVRGDLAPDLVSRDQVPDPSQGLEDLPGDERIAQDLPRLGHSERVARGVDQAAELLLARLAQAPAELALDRVCHPGAAPAGRSGIIVADMTRSTLEEYRQAAATTLEDDWITEADRDPADADWFFGIAEGFIAAGESDRVRGLVELWDEQLRERRLWPLRLELLRRLGPLVHKPAKLHKEVVTTLEGIWGGRPNFAATLEWVGLRKVVEDAAKLWDRVNRLNSILLYDVGAVVAMKGQGVGRVVEINLTLETLKIDFEKKSGVTLGFRAAAKMLRLLEPGHLLRRKLEDPDGLARLRDERPAELLRAVLEAAEHPLTAGEIREALAGIVEESQWTSWWAAARRHPQVVAHGSGRQSYGWEASASGALDSVRRSFARADSRKRIELFRRNYERDATLGRELAGDLASTASEATVTDPGLAWEIFFVLERSGLLPDSLAGLADRLVAPESDPRALLTGIADRLLRERALAMLRERRDDWPAIFRDHLAREEDPRVLSLLAAGLEEGDREGLDRTLDDVVAQPRRAPALFTWLAERAAHSESLRARAPMRLLQQLLAALGSDDFTTYRTRLKPLVDSGGTVPRLLVHLDETQAGAALELLRKTVALEPFEREALATTLRVRFPNLDEPQTAGPLYATPGAIAARHEELKRLAEVEIPANRKAIEEARAMGDLRENFEYKSARQRHEYLNARVAALHRDLSRARPIEHGEFDSSEVRIGSAVELEGEGSERRRYRILGPWDSRPEQGVISYESELGQKLLGRRAGDRVQVGDNEFRVAAITPAI